MPRRLQSARIRLTVYGVAIGQLRIKVSDTGPGIPKEKMHRLFAPFDRLGAEQTEIEGTGLGLTLCKHLVEAMGGTLGVESVEGRGSTFWVKFTQAEAPSYGSPLSLTLDVAP